MRPLARRLGLRSARAPPRACVRRRQSRASRSRATPGESLPIPQGERARGLIPDPGPRELHHHAPHVGIAGACDPLLATHLPALIEGRRETDQRPELAAVADLAPAKHFRRQDPGTNRTDRADGLEPRGVAASSGARISRERDRSVRTWRSSVSSARRCLGSCAGADARRSGSASRPTVGRLRSELQSQARLGGGRPA